MDSIEWFELGYQDGLTNKYRDVRNEDYWRGQETALDDMKREKNGEE